jgi:hypothetical protein
MKYIPILLTAILGYYYYKKISGLISSDEFKPTVMISLNQFAGISKFKPD